MVWPPEDLDASNDHEITRRIWGDDTREVKIDVERQAEIVQIGTKGFSNQSIKGVGTDGKPLTAKSEQEASRLRREIATLVAGAPGPVLVVSNKDVEEVLRQELPADTTTTHFAALRGVNAFENHRTAIMVLTQHSCNQPQSSTGFFPGSPPRTGQ